MTALELFAGAAAATLPAAGLPALEADVRAVDFAAWRDRVDLLWASPPCQPGSTAGQVGNAVPPALAQACGRLVAGAHRAWAALRSSNLDHPALAGALRRHRLTVPAHLGAAP